MKIVVVSTSFPRDEDDHAGRFVFDLSFGLARLGHELHHVVPADRRESSAAPLSENMTLERVRYAPIRSMQTLAYGNGVGANVVRRPWRALLMPSLMLAMRRAVLRRIATHGADVLLSHWLVPAGWIDAGVSRRHGIKHVVCEHSGGLHLLMRLPFGARILRSIVQRTDHLVFVSEDLRRKAEALIRGPLPCATSVRPMGIDTERFSAAARPDDPTRESLGLAPTTKVVLAVGRLVPIKGFDLLIEAASGLGGIELLFAGDGPEREALEALAGRLGVRARFLGHVPPRRLPGLYRVADVVAAPSRIGRGRRSEGFPMVIAEALSCGRPIIASRSGGIGELLAEDAMTSLIEPGRVDELRSTLVETLDRSNAGRTSDDPTVRRFDRLETARHFDGVIRLWSLSSACR